MKDFCLTDTDMTAYLKSRNTAGGERDSLWRGEI